MTYEATGSFGFLSPFRNRGMLGLGASTPPPNTVCVGWVAAAYDLVGYEQMRAVDLPLLQLRAKRLFGPGAWSDAAFAMSKFERWGTAARGNKTEIDRFYTAWLPAVIQLLQDTGDLIQRMAAALNLPPVWLIPSNPATAKEQHGLVTVNFSDPATVLWPDGQGDTGASRTLASFPPGSYGSPTIESAARAAWNRAQLSLSPASASSGMIAVQGAPYDFYGRKGSSGGFPSYANSAAKLLDIWKKSKFSNRPRGGSAVAAVVSEPFGYPAGRTRMPGPPAPVWELVPAAVWLPPGNQIAGPRAALFAANEALARVGGRPAVQVLQNAFESWGSIIVAWADSNENPLKEKGKQQVRMAGASIKLAGTAIAGVGTVAANPIVAGVGTVISLLGALYSEIIPVTVKCPTGTYSKYHKKLGGFCGPPEPFLIQPPAGCGPGDVLNVIRGERETDWEKFLRWLKQYGPYIGLGAVGLIGAYVAFTMMKKNPRRRPRRRNARRRNAGELFRVYDKHDPRFLMLTFESEPEAIAYAKGTTSRQPHREMQIEVREGKQWRSLATWSRNRNRGR